MLQAGGEVDRLPTGTGGWDFEVALKKVGQAFFSSRQDLPWGSVAISLLGWGKGQRKKDIIHSLESWAGSAGHPSWTCVPALDGGDGEINIAHLIWLVSQQHVENGVCGPLHPSGRPQGDRPQSLILGGPRGQSEWVQWEEPDGVHSCC